MGHEIIQVLIGGHSVGLIGLQAVFSEIKELNLADDEELKAEIINRVRNKNYISENVEESYKKALFREFQKYRGEAIEEEHDTLEILILGPGCPRCDELLRRVRTAAAELDLPADIQHIRDLKKIANFGPVPTPVLVVNGQIKSSGKVQSKEEIKKLIT